MNERFQWTRRDEAMASIIDGSHFRFRRRPSVSLSPGEVQLSKDWRLNLAAPTTPLTNQMRVDFERFCAICMGVSFSPAAEATPSLTWRLRDPLPEPFNRADPEIETFTIQVSDSAIEIESRHERGLLQATHYLEWMMVDRGGPFLAKQILNRTPALMPRISNGTFVPADQSLKNPGRFSDEYLGLMSHYGSNGIYLALNLSSVFKSESLPELNSADFSDQIASLRAFNQRTLAFGIDTYLHISTPLLNDSHPVFKAHPEVRGALAEIFVEELSGRPWYNLCSGNSKVRAAYGETLRNLLSAAPEVAGISMVIGGESFYHCFTRPANSRNGETNCPNCQGKSASLEVASLTNSAAHAIKQTGEHKLVFAWPYSAFIWSKGDSAEVEWIRNLDESVSVLSNFDCGDNDNSTGSGAKFFDYNIKCLGPSETFAKQAATAKELGRPIFTKIESCVTPDAFFLPYLPLHFRWHERFSRVKQAGVRGFLGQWRFFGVTGSPPEELQYRLIWADGHCDEALRLYCARDFGLTGTGIEDVLAGWKLMSEAWEDYPYSAMTSGERAAYMRGPFYLGPAHPLIFDVQDSYRLPETFFLLRGDLREGISSEEELRELQKNAKPRYVSDLLVTLPFGVERHLELTMACRKKWNAGLVLLRSQLSDRGEAARKELNICETIGSHLCTLENTVRFYAARDQLQNVRCTLEEFKNRLNALVEIINHEIANAESMLPIVEEDVRIGYGYCYGTVYDAEMIRQKIAQCRRVRDVELPRFSQVVRFHVWNESP